MNKAKVIYDMVKEDGNKTRYVLTTSAGIFNGYVEFPMFDCLYQDYSAYETIVLKKGFLQLGPDKITLDDTYVFLDSIIAISPAAVKK